MKTIKDLKQRLKEIEEEKVRLEKIIQEKTSADIINKIKTFEDAFELLSDVEKKEFIKFCKHAKKHTIAFEKMVIIAKTLNEGWEPNWSNANENKYYPRFNMNPFGFGVTFYVYWATDSITGSRRCFKIRRLAEYAGKQFEDIYKEFMVL